MFLIGGKVVHPGDIIRLSRADQVNIYRYCDFAFDAAPPQDFIYLSREDMLLVLISDEHELFMISSKGSSTFKKGDKDLEMTGWEFVQTSSQE